MSEITIFRQTTINEEINNNDNKLKKLSSYSHFLRLENYYCNNNFLIVKRIEPIDLIHESFNLFNDKEIIVLEKVSKYCNPKKIKAKITHAIKSKYSPACIKYMIAAYISLELKKSKTIIKFLENELLHGDIFSGFYLIHIYLHNKNDHDKLFDSINVIESFFDYTCSSSGNLNTPIDYTVKKELKYKSYVTLGDIYYKIGKIFVVLKQPSLYDLYFRKSIQAGNSLAREFIL